MEDLNFGLVSYGYQYSLSFQLINTCAIPFEYRWSVRGDSPDPSTQEFKVPLSSRLPLRVVTGLFHTKHSAPHTLQGVGLSPQNRIFLLQPGPRLFF